MRQRSELETIYAKALALRQLADGTYEEVWYSLEVDMTKLHSAAKRAASSKGKIRRIGPLVVRVMATKPL
jgi:hypothetical protein